MCNGMVERMNSTLLQMLRTLEETCKSKWKDELNKLIYAYNCTKHSVTGYSPYYLLLGRTPQLPVDFILKGKQQIEAEDHDYSNYSKMWKERMNEAYEIANQNTRGRRHQDKTKKDIKATLQPLQVGDKVLVRNLNPREGSGKIKSFWEQKVHRIEEVKDPDGLVYTVKEIDKPNSRNRTLHRNNIMSCHNLPHNDQYNKTNKDTTQPGKNYILRNKVSSKNKESKFSSDEENSSSSNEENEMVDHVRNLKFIGIEPSKVRSSQSQAATYDDRKKVCKSKEDEVMFERDVITNQADNIIAETGRTQSRGNRVVKSIELTEDEEDYRAVKTIELVRDNQYIDKIEYNDDQIENGSNNQHGRKKYNLRSDEYLQTVNVVEADSSSRVRVGG